MRLGYLISILFHSFILVNLDDQITLSKDSTSTSTVSNAIDYVDVFFGTEGGGNVFPGSSRPFGMIKMGVDVFDSSSGNAYSGYAADGHINGLSMMHESGTGGAPEYGVVSQLPWLGDIDLNSQVYLTRQSADSGSVGSYQANFTNGIGAELAAASRSGIFHYDFGSGNDEPKILVNASHHLTAPARPWWSQYFVNGTISTTDDNQQYTGESYFKGGWGEQLAWKVYYCGDFDTKPKSITSFQNGQTLNESSITSTSQDESFGIVFEFDSSVRSMKSRVGVSFKSVDQACSNIKADFDDSYDIDQTIKETINQWNKELFDVVEINTGNNDTLTGIIYSSLYGSHLLPTNRTGEHPSDDWNDDDVYYDDWFTIWDTFRCLHPLINVLNPKRASEIIQSLTNIYKYEGYTPDGRSANQNGRTQGGSNSDILMADAYLKNINDNVDWSTAYKAMVNNAEVAPPYAYDSFAPDASNKQGRGALPDWLEYGYITRNYTRSVTRTMEYAYDDYALSVVAKGLGNNDDYEKYLKRSSNWQNLWNFEATSSKFNYTGFIQPKNADGSFNYTNYDPTSCGSCYWSNDEYEGTPVEYGWAVPHDIETLKQFIGSNETFSQRLDDMFALFGSEDIIDIGNEPSFLTPYLYNFVNENHKTVDTIRYLINTKFSTGTKSLAGNSDAGAMQSWYFWALIGVYPVAGTTTYLISSPFIPYTKINLSNGKTVEIIANNLSNENIYIQSLKLNGDSLNVNWFQHDDLFKNGGTLEFELGSNKIAWESGDVPPSPGHNSK